MATPTNEEVIRAWWNMEARGGAPPPKHPRFRYEPGVLISVDWGEFPLAMALRPGGKKISCILLNGDLGSPTNRSHQRHVRWTLRRWPKGIPPIMIVPFSAMDAASIDRWSVRPIEVNDDRNIEIRHDVRPWKEKDIVWAPVQNPPYYSVFQRGEIPGRPELYFHRRVNSEGVVVGEAMRAYLRPWLQIQGNKKEGFYAIERRHMLGDSVFRAKVGNSYRTFVSSFDYQEPSQLYFLAEVPGPVRSIRSVDDAILALSPPIVHAAVAQGRQVKRQGDMFAIPTSLTTKDVKARTKSEIVRMQGVIGTDHVATESVVGKGRVTYARGWLHHQPRGRRPDHLRTYLGKDWHLVVPNAVPRRRRGVQVRT